MTINFKIKQSKGNTAPLFLYPPTSLITALTGNIPGDKKKEKTRSLKRNPELRKLTEGCYSRHLISLGKGVLHLLTLPDC